MELDNNVVEMPDRSDNSTASKLAKRWGGHDVLFSKPEGWVGVPDAFLRLYSKLQLTVGEAMFIVQLMTFKWTANAPFPSYKRLAKRMGLTDKMLRRYAAQVEAKGYLRRQARIGSTNSFDLQPLFDALAAALQAERGSTTQAA